MTAIEACEASRINEDKLVENQIKLIDETIAEKIKEGKFECYVPNEISSCLNVRTINTFKGRGFKLIDTWKCAVTVGGFRWQLNWECNQD